MMKSVERTKAIMNNDQLNDSEEDRGERSNEDGTEPRLEIWKDRGARRRLGQSLATPVIVFGANEGK